MRGLTIALLTLTTVVAAEEPATPPIEWGTWYDGQGNRADTGIADTDGDDWLTVVADGKAVLEIRVPRATTDATAALAERVLQLERQVADLTRRLDEERQRRLNDGGVAVVCIDSHGYYGPCEDYSEPTLTPGTP